MTKTKKIILTGGGTAGHVTPNMALIEDLQQAGFDVHYIGAPHSVEQSMISAIHIPYSAVRCGKLRRYFSWKNFLEPFNITLGIIQAYGLLQKLKPDVIFSKGGFVAFPVIVAAYLHKIPAIAHG